MTCHVCGHLKYLLHKRWLYFPPSVRLTLPAFTTLPAVCVVSILLVSPWTVSVLVVSALSSLSSCPTIATSMGYTNHTGQSLTEHWDHLQYQDMYRTWTQVNTRRWFLLLILHFEVDLLVLRLSLLLPITLCQALAMLHHLSGTEHCLLQGKCLTHTEGNIKLTLRLHFLFPLGKVCDYMTSLNMEDTAKSYVSTNRSQLLVFSSHFTF